MPSAGVPSLDHVELPIDATGLLTAPATPKPRKRRLCKDGLLRKIRKSRARCLRTPVMTVVVGRQLGSPVCQALRTIANGGIGDLTSIAPVDPTQIVSPIPVSA